MNGKRVLITGGNGYIGGRLANFLKNDCDIVLSSRSSIRAPTLSHLKSLKIDWESEQSLDKACKGIDIIIHTAAMNSQQACCDPTSALLVNTVATSRLLQAAKKNHVKRFIYLSTSHVYGKALNGLISEESCPVAFDPYSSSHRAAEDLVLHEHLNNNIEGIVVRLSNAFGYPMHKNVKCWGLLIPDLCLQGVKSDSLKLNSSGVRLINFVTISDIVRAIQHLLFVPIDQFNTPIFNIGGKETSVSSMTELIAKRFLKLKGKPLGILCNPRQETEKISDFIYSSRMIESTGFSALNNINKEIDDLINFCYESF